jgi:ABC-2 type transport system permease protein
VTAAQASRVRRAWGQLASEWTKLRSVRSTLWTLLITASTAVGGSGTFAFASAGQPSTPFDPVTGTFIAWVEYPVLAVGVLGALSITNEYASGQIRTTFTAVPQRHAVLVAKAAVLGGLVLVVGELLAFMSFAVTDVVLAAHHRAVGLGEAGVLRSVLAAGVIMASVALLGLGLGVVVRQTAGAIIALPGVLYVPLMVLILPSPWNHEVGRFGMLAAAYQLVSPEPHDTMLPLPAALVVLLAWPAVALVVAGVLVSRRDA